MKETIIRSEVSIGEMVYLVYKDTIAKGCERYHIEATYVTDISVYHGFTLSPNDDMWRDNYQIGTDVFFTLDEAIKSIQLNKDFKGCCVHTSIGTIWEFKRRGEGQK